MKVLVLFESFFGNTEQIAKSIGNTLKQNNDVIVKPVSEALLDEVMETDILIVGSATRGFKPCEETLQLLKKIPSNALQGKKVAAFDTRLSLPDIKSKMVRYIVKKGGYAAKQIAKQLKKEGGELVVAAEGFLVSDEKGPLVNGELTRAAEWANKIVNLNY